MIRSGGGEWSCPLCGQNDARILPGECYEK